MQFGPDQLAALVAVVDEGTFEAAARRLSITPSAVSQRVRALESQVGQVLVVRASPCRPTETGTILLRLARQQQWLESEALAELQSGGFGGFGGLDRADLPIAVNADSLATWFSPVMAECAAWSDVVLRLFVEDQDHSAALLRAGTVLGAVTADPVAVQGCSVERLGTFRYLPVATPAVLERNRQGRSLRWAELPMVRFNNKDDLQHRILRAHGVTTSPPTHYVPSSEGFLTAVRAGLGWGAIPEQQIGDDLSTGRLVRLSARDIVNVDLFWQCWRLRSPRVERITAVVRSAATALAA
jgi:LysR family transcriptional regulator (chromosome initiation inhibitor)